MVFILEWTSEIFKELKESAFLSLYLVGGGTEEVDEVSFFSKPTITLSTFPLKPFIAFSLFLVLDKIWQNIRNLIKVAVEDHF